MNTYYRLAKPGIIYANVITAIAGYLFGSHWHIDWSIFLSTVAGTVLIIASGCVWNNILDRSIDQVMNRTKDRALVRATIPVDNAAVYATILGVIGFALLAAWSRPIVIIIGAIAFIDYVVLYGLAKRRSVHSTLIGSISGAASLTAGYCAATGRFDLGAIMITIIIILWQMAHFYGIALYRRQDYAAAGLPIMSVVKGAVATKHQTIAYIVAFIISCTALTLVGPAGHTFLYIMLITGGIWLWRSLVRHHGDSTEAWGRGVFLDSLVVNLILSASIATATILP